MTMKRVPGLRGGFKVHCTPKRISIKANCQSYRNIWKRAIKEGYADPLSMLVQAFANKAREVKP